MRKSIFWILCLLLMGSWGELKGQTEPDEICTYKPSFNFLGELPESLFLQGDLENDYVLRVYIHVIRRADGTGGRTLAEVDQVIANLNNGFGTFPDTNGDGIEESIKFRFEEVNYIDCDRYYLYGSSLENLMSENEHTNGIDIYLFSSQLPGGGAAYSNPSTSLYLGGNTPIGNFYENSPIVDIGQSNVIVHEMGHCLGLYHVYQSFCKSSVSCHETADNGETCGDYVVDTPPIWNRRNKVYDPTCLPSTSDLSCNNPNYPNPIEDDDSDLINYMQYTHPSCMSEFTHGQRERMMKTLKTSKILRACLTDELPSNNYIIAPPIVFTQLTGSTLLTGQTKWETPQEVTGEVVIPNGAELVIQNTTIRFADVQSGITVKKGGILRVRNSKLTVDKCANVFAEWRGIIVEGYGGKKLIQAPISPQFGYVEVVNNSKIEFAETAIKAIGHTWAVPYTQSNLTGTPVNSAKLGDGMLFVSRSIFRNNDSSIEMKYLHDESAENSLIYENKFINSSSAALQKAIFINLVNMGHVSIRGNSFEDIQDFVNPMTGIRAVNTSLDIGGIQDYEKNTFSNLKIGIDIYNTNTVLLTEIINNRFYQNTTGIALHHVPNATIQLNTFIVPSFFNAKAIISYDAISFDISSNHFKRFNPNLGELGRGLVVVNSKQEDGGFLPTSTTLENTFCGLFTAATQFELNNTGLQMQCNHYNNSARDWYLANTESDYEWDIVNQVYILTLPRIDELRDQGDCGSQFSKNPFGNTWHTIGGGNAVSKHIVNHSDRKLVLAPDDFSIPTQIEVGPLGDDGEVPTTEIDNDACGLAEVNCSEPLDCGNNNLPQMRANTGRGIVYTQLKAGNEAGVITSLENNQEEWSDKWLVGIYANQRDYTKTSQTLNRIPQNSPINIAFHDLFQALINTQGDFTAVEEQIIRNHALSPYFDTQILAEMFLAEYFDESFERTPRPIAIHSSKKEQQYIEGDNFKLVPNPAHTHVKILPPTFVEDEYFQLQILDVSGKVLFNQLISSAFSLDTKNLEEGIYFVALQSTQTNQFYTKKLVILR